MKKLISIIVPVYRTEAYIEKCIDSIINQTYKNIEIILVNDGSPDNCGKICDEYKLKDARIKVIHKENSGPSDTRNCGIALSSGDYLMFVDSDDYIAENMCESLVKIAEEYDADIVGCNFIYVRKDGSTKINEQLQNKAVEVFSNMEMINKLFFSFTVDLSVLWNKLYARKVFYGNGNNQLSFPSGRVHEDDYLLYKLYYYANKIVVINKILYYYIRHSDSIMGSFSNQNILDKIDNSIEQYKFMEMIEDETLYAMVQSYALNIYFEWLPASRENSDIKAKLKEYKSYILKYDKDVLKNPYMNWKRYIKYIFLRLNLEDMAVFLGVLLNKLRSCKKYLSWYCK